MIVKKTISLCPTCYRQVPAAIDIRAEGVFLTKECPEHGLSGAMVERSPEYYMQCLQAGATNIYNGYFLDVTERCNLKCRYCYYGTSNAPSPSIEALRSEAMINAPRAPIILTGGEPSLRGDLPELIHEIQQIAPVELLTNGTGLDDACLDEIIPLLNAHTNVASINLSIHAEANGQDLNLIERISERGKKLESVLFVIDSLDQIEGVLSFGARHKDSIEAIRIKAATRLWSEKKPTEKIFVSDMWDHVQKHNPTPLWWRNNKTSFFNFGMDGVYYMLVSWYDIENVDLLDIACPPFYRAKNGQIENIVTACLINEGMSKGWLNGREYHG